MLLKTQGPEPEQFCATFSGTAAVAVTAPVALDRVIFDPPPLLPTRPPRLLSQPVAMTEPEANERLTIPAKVVSPWVQLWLLPTSPPADANQLTVTSPVARE